ncbi:MAG TPA: C1 family peptidase [Acidimicrobiia bacterium]
MRRRAGFAGTSLAISLVAAVLSGGSAFGAGLGHSSPARSSAVALPALGRRPPTRRFALAPPVATIAPSTAAAVAPPASVDLRKWAVTPGYQGQVNSCVPWTIDYAMLGWYSRYTGRTGQPFAPMYTYSQIDGGGDYGSDATTALQLALAQGNDTRADYTQGDYNWASPPTAVERTNAARFEIKGYETIVAGVGLAGTVPALQHALATNHPVAIGMAVRDGFDNLGTSPTAVDNDSTGAIRGYHEVLAVGYDAAGLIVENSWGRGWADGGFGRISWRVVQEDVAEGETIDGFAQAATAPTVSAPAVALGAPATGNRTTINARVTWKGMIGNTGAITNYYAWYQVDGRAFVAVTLASATATSFSHTLTVGRHYRIAIRARAGLLGAIHYGPTFVA